MKAVRNPAKKMRSKKKKKNVAQHVSNKSGKNRHVSKNTITKSRVAPGGGVANKSLQNKSKPEMTTPESK